MTRVTLAATLVVAVFCVAVPAAAQQRPQGLQRYGEQPYGIVQRPPLAGGGFQGQPARRGAVDAPPFRFYNGTHGLGLAPPAGAATARSAGRVQPPRVSAPPRPR